MIACTSEERCKLYSTGKFDPPELPPVVSQGDYACSPVSVTSAASLAPAGDPVDAPNPQPSEQIQVPGTTSVTSLSSNFRVSHGLKDGRLSHSSHLKFSHVDLSSLTIKLN